MNGFQYVECCHHDPPPKFSSRTVPETAANRRQDESNRMCTSVCAMSVPKCTHADVYSTGSAIQSSTQHLRTRRGKSKSPSDNNPPGKRSVYKGCHKFSLSHRGVELVPSCENNAVE
eukprot:6206955-Amphidinium_carterae.1